MFVLARSVTYATLFIALVLIFVPGRILERTGIVQPSQPGVVEYAGMVVTAVGGAICVWCILTFTFVGRGTPAPFDPPRKLVVSGPYRYVRNPMYIGAVLALCGAAMYFGSGALFAYVAIIFVIMHLFVVWYEEPTLSRLFGSEYEAYQARVARWVVRMKT